MRECYRPYTKFVAMTNGNSLAVDLHDTSGNAVTCNYITVTAVSGGVSDTIFNVTPVGLHKVSLDATSTNNHASSLPGIASTSGVTGLVGDTMGGSVVFSLNLFDAISQIIISQSTDASTGFAVTYGAVVLSNPRADDSIDIGT
jgi:hypothetical protein